MDDLEKDNHTNSQWLVRLPTFLLVLMLVYFLVFSMFVACNLKMGIIPDEPSHYIFSKHFSTTARIPPDVFETYSTGWYIKQNPFLYYWINGRIINTVELINPTVSEWTQLVILRLVNTLFSLGTILFLYLLSKETIKSRWWQLFPVFLLTNTLMFVFLSGGLNYDNLTNMFCMAGLLYLTRVINGKDYLVNSMTWMVFICLGTLTKYTVLPLALFMFVVWIFYSIKYRKSLNCSIQWNLKKFVLGLLLIALLLGNVAIYGYNLVVYQSIRPNCSDLLTLNQCALSPYSVRYTEIALDRRMTVAESIRQGFPDPIVYFFDTWIPEMLYRIFGILGHKYYFPYGLTTFYRIMLGWIVLLGFRYTKRMVYLDQALVLIYFLYMFTLFIYNYKDELVYGFKHIAMQGRYIFPVIGSAYVILVTVIHKVSNKFIRQVTLVGILALFFIGGPINMILRYHIVFVDWFIN